MSLISVIIPIKNGEATLEKCLSGIYSQSIADQVEVIILDSGSTDDSLTICSKFPTRIIPIEPSTFNHGLTRNFGVLEAAGEFIVTTVQDAYPAETQWLERMLLHFEDTNVIGVCGQQIVPHDADKNPHEWFRPYSEPKPKEVHFTDASKLISISAEDLHDACGWDNVNAMYRKSALLAFPFPDVSFGEDMAWAKRIVLEGKKIIYDYSCRVHHYHHSTYDYTYKRTLTTLYFIYKNFGYIREINFNKTDYFKVIYRNLKYKVSPYWILFNWNKMKAMTQAYQDVLRFLKVNEAELDRYHEYKCGIPPQGKQSKSIK